MDFVNILAVQVEEDVPLMRTAFWMRNAWMGFVNHSDLFQVAVSMIVTAVSTTIATRSMESVTFREVRNLVALMIATVILTTIATHSMEFVTSQEVRNSVALKISTVVLITIATHLKAHVFSRESQGANYGLSILVVPGKSTANHIFGIIQPVFTYQIIFPGFYFSQWCGWRLY